MMHKNKSNKSNSKNTRLIGTMIVVIVAVIGAALLMLTKAAPNSSLSLNPSSGSVEKGSNLTVGIYEESGTQPVNSTSVKLSYDTAKLQFVDISTSGSAFTGGCADKSESNGIVSLACFILPTASPSSVTGKNLIGTVTFTAKVSNSTTTLTFLKQSEENSGIFLVGSGENIWNGATSGGTYTLGGGTTTPPTGGGGTTTPPTTSGGGSTAPTSSSSSNNSKPKTSSSTPSSSNSSGSTSSAAPSDGGTFSAGDSTVASTEVASSNSSASKLNTNAIVMYAAVIGGAIAVVSVSGVAFAKVQRRNKFNRAHGMGKNSAVVFDANSSVHNPQTNSIDQGPMVMPSAPAQPVTSAAPIQPITHSSGPQQGSIITPDNKPPSA